MSKFLLLTLFFLISCETVTTGFQEELSAEQEASGNPDSNDPNVILQNALDNAVDAPPVVEVRHLVEPKVDEQTTGGSYLKKLTIPRNYRGKLYLAGINLSTLHGKDVYVRFYFGANKEPTAELGAEVATTSAPGLTDNTPISVLVVNMRTRPFANRRLRYDLYDYNDYTFDGQTASTALENAVSYNRDKNLFCRGLALEDDPTFEGSTSCEQTSDICKYAYANVIDQGLTFENSVGRIAINPTRRQIASTDSGYYSDSDSEILSRCLPADPTEQQNITGTFFNFNNTITFSNFSERLISGTLYRYEGPFKLIESTTWQITANSNATVNKFGLFRPQSGLRFNYYNSLLYPRYVKDNLDPGVQYLGSATPKAAKTVQTMGVSGESLWMDGCNARAMTYNATTAEHIGSCDVTASIEVFYKDESSNEIIITTSKDVKLQLVQDSFEDSSDLDVLDASVESCSSTSQCSTGECCINNRCWDRSIASACVEDEPSYGNAVTGATCSSDYECASLCCQSGRCQVHDETQNPQILCSKQVGQSCIAKNWCAKQPIKKCYIVKTTTDPTGGQQCALRCYTVLESGECRNNVCAAPAQPEQPVFNPSDPNRCNDACDPPDFSSGVFAINCPSN